MNSATTAGQQSGSGDLVNPSSDELSPSPPPHLPPQSVSSPPELERHFKPSSNSKLFDPASSSKDGDSKSSANVVTSSSSSTTSSSSSSGSDTNRPGLRRRSSLDVLTSTTTTTWNKLKLRASAMMLRSLVIPGQWIGKLLIRVDPNVVVYTVQFPSRDPGRTITGHVYRKRKAQTWSSPNECSGSDSIPASSVATPKSTATPYSTSTPPSYFTPVDNNNDTHKLPRFNSSNNRSRSMSSTRTSSYSSSFNSNNIWSSKLKKATSQSQHQSGTSSPLPMPIHSTSLADGVIERLALESESQEQVPLPIHINLHGSGWTLPCLGTDAEFCSKLARETDSIVIDLDYRKAPEHPFPAALHDLEDVVRRIFIAQDATDENQDAHSVVDDEGRELNHPFALSTHEIEAQVREELKLCKRETIRDPGAKVSLSGFSSGGNLALSLCVLLAGVKHTETTADICRNLPTPDYYANRIGAVIGFYCTVDMRRTAWLDVAPDLESLGGKDLPQFIRNFFRSCYTLCTQSQPLDDPFLSPALAPISCFPPHILLTCGTADPNYVADQKWIRHLNEQGHPDASFISVKGLGHAFDKHCRAGSYAAKVSDLLYDAIIQCILRSRNPLENQKHSDPEVYINPDHFETAEC